jgi:hypothetical protein
MLYRRPGQARSALRRAQSRALARGRPVSLTRGRPAIFDPLGPRLTRRTVTLGSVSRAMRRRF